MHWILETLVLLVSVAISLYLTSRVHKYLIEKNDASLHDGRMPFLGRLTVIFVCFLPIYTILLWLAGKLFP